jgi:hemoglobin-like flavoprotein
MTPAQVSLVQSSFQKIAPIADQAAALFYARLFELDPALRLMFRGDLHEQGRKLMSMLSMAVASLERLESLLPTVRALGARHGNYGVIEEHYATVGAALIWTLQKGLGSEFTPAVADAWTTTYSLLANTMIEAQRSARTAAVAVA